MKAVVCHEFGPLENLKVEDIPSPSAGAGQVKIRVRACGVNFPDILLVQGLYQVKPPTPFSPGLEVAGEIVDVGAGVSDLKVGDRVMSTLMWGGFAEEVVAPSGMTLPMPADMSFEQAAAFQLVYGTVPCRASPSRATASGRDAAGAGGGGRRRFGCG